MRKSHKYKIYSKVGFVSKFPVRILNFKRPKWNKVKDIIQNQFGHDSNFVDITIIKKEFKVWEKLRRFYKERMQTYSLLSTVFDHSINIKKLKSNKNSKSKKNNYIKYFFNTYYKVCGLLWFSNFFLSSFESRQKINSNFIFVNKEKAFANILLKKGDLIEIKDFDINISKVIKKYNLTTQFLSYIEIDYYSQSIIIIKDITELTEEDSYLLFTNYINTLNLR